MDFGSAVVYLTSQLYAPDALYIETSLGVCKQIPLQELPDYLKEFKVGRQHYLESGASTLPIKCLVLGLPDSGKIGHCFSQLGVKHVVVFGQVVKDEQNRDMEKVLMSIRYKYIHQFTQHFLVALVESKTSVK